ncbi:MAG: TIGR02186 family protein [Acidobacteria bacterium]|nr:TIGR02186 family protein [Acidobacteriota bacterium]
MVALLVGMLVWPAASSAAAEAGAIVVAPDHVTVNLFYNGSDLHIRVQLPANAGAAVRLTGLSGRVELKQKGKVAGILWMNVADVDLDGVPIIYYLLTSAPLRDMAPPRELATWKLGSEALLPDESPGGPYRDQFVKLKQRDGLYRVLEGALTKTGGGEGGSAVFEGTLSLPAKIPPGTWQVELFGFEHGHVARLAAVPLTIEYAGVVRAMHGLAMDHGTVYGWMSVVIAIAVGLLTGVLFSTKSQKGH